MVFTWYNLHMDIHIYKGFSANIEYDQDDNIFVGVLVGIGDIVCFHSDTIEGAKAVFIETVDDYLAANSLLFDR
jgi:predicted HicB family RNase H-like nuclease